MNSGIECESQGGHSDPEFSPGHSNIRGWVKDKQSSNEVRKEQPNKKTWKTRRQIMPGRRERSVVANAEKSNEIMIKN